MVVFVRKSQKEKKVQVNGVKVRFHQIVVE